MLAQFERRYHKKTKQFVGHLWRCTKCASAYKMEWANKNNVKDRRKAYFEAYNATEIANKRKAEWKKQNREKNAAINKRWRQNNRALQVQYAMAHYRRYPHVITARNAKKRADKIQATPKWADLKAIAEIYRRAREITAATGIKHSVDHIVPLKNPLVCGLHCEANLRVIPHTDNCKKYNTLVEELVHDVP